MRILLFSRLVKEDHLTSIRHLIDLLVQKQRDYFCTPEISKAMSKTEQTINFDIIDSYESLAENKIDCIISLGGDGTILHATTMVRDLEVPQTLKVSPSCVVFYGFRTTVSFFQCPSRDMRQQHRSSRSSYRG